MTAARGRKPTTAQEASGAAPRLLHHVPHPPPLQRAGFTPRRGPRPPAAAPTAGGLSRTCSARPRRVEIGEDHGEIEDGGGRQGQGLQHPELNMRLFHKILETERSQRWRVQAVSVPNERCQSWLLQDVVVPACMCV
ncbi:uncharacterized protein LOC120665849 [Panicum virgatum]|uniref:uncharacterized protein LOC120665849 n=1 Tax=Panicum virgatum TaxID=38727 RepID=UPI0019D5A1AB|nr:uncharacterized protein LOC120665849 [Panicum virgatum]